MALALLVAALVHAGGEKEEQPGPDGGASPAPARVRSETRPPDSEPRNNRSPVSRVDLDDRQTMAHMLNAVLSLRRRPVPNTAVFDAIAAQPDPIYTAPLIDLLFFVREGNPVGVAIAGALRETSGTDRGTDWRAYFAAAGRNDISLPQGYAEFKSRLLSELVDPAFAQFFPPGVQQTSRVNLVEIVWGGVAVDGIPSLDTPTQIDPEQAARQGRRLTEFCRETEDGLDCRYPAPDELVFGVSIGGEARAYPLRILNWHELLNDVVGVTDRQVALVYCTLCGSAILYDTSVGPVTYTDPRTGARVTLDKGALEFGTTGLLMRSNKLMYDRETLTVWNAMTGRPAFGPLAEVEDLVLEKLPVVVTDWSSWYAAHPNTTVLSLRTGYDRDYTNGAAYRTYFDDRTSLMFPVWRREEHALQPKEMVFGLESTGARKAYPLEALVASSVVNDRVGNQTVVLVARATPEREFFEPGGAAVRAYQRGNRRFTSGPDDRVVIDEDNRKWRVTEEALVGPSGARFERLPGHLSFWFGWSAFHPETEVYSPTTGEAYD